MIHYIICYQADAPEATFQSWKLQFLTNVKTVSANGPLQQKELLLVLECETESRFVKV